MSYLERLTRRFPRPTPTGTPTQAPAVGPVVLALEAGRRRLRLPACPDDLRPTAQPVPEALQQVVIACVDILRRRPQLQKRVGLSADQLEELRRKEIDLDILLSLCGRIAQALRDGQLLQTERLAAQNEAAAATFDRFVRDEAAPVEARHRVAACTEAIRAAEQRRQKRRQDTARRRQGKLGAGLVRLKQASEAVEAGQLRGELLGDKIN